MVIVKPLKCNYSLKKPFEGSVTSCDGESCLGMVSSSRIWSTPAPMEKMSFKFLNLVKAPRFFVSLKLRHRRHLHMFKLNLTTDHLISEKVAPPFSIVEEKFETQRVSIEVLKR